MFLHAALNLSLRFVVVNWIEMRLAGQNPPSEFFPDVVNASVGADFNFIFAISMHTACDFLPGRNDERMIAAGTNSYRVFAACHVGPKRRAAVSVRSINVYDGLGRRRR